MTKISLTVFIPTYNRARFLGYLLESIIRDLAAWPDDLELIVSDNASTDNTRELVAQFIDRGVPLTYVVNDRNLGPDENIAAGFRLASGKYVWIIGDDDILYQGALGHVLEICRKADFGIIHLKNHGFVHGQQEEISLRKIPAYIKSRDLDSKQMFSTANVFLTFISANVINRAMIMASDPAFNPQAELNTNLIQMTWTYAALKAGKKHLHIRSPLLAALGENTSGYKLIEVFGTNLKNITGRYMDDLLPDADRIMVNAVIIRLLPRQLMSQLQNSKTKNQFLDADLRTAARACFQACFLFNVFIEPLFSRSPIKRNVAFLAVRAFHFLVNKLNYRPLAFF